MNLKGDLSATLYAVKFSTLYNPQEKALKIINNSIPFRLKNLESPMFQEGEYNSLKKGYDKRTCNTSRTYKKKSC